MRRLREADKHNAPDWMRRHYWYAFVAEINSRSPEQVKRMERAMEARR